MTSSEFTSTATALGGGCIADGSQGNSSTLGSCLSRFPLLLFRVWEIGYALLQCRHQNRTGLLLYRGKQIFLSERRDETGLGAASLIPLTHGCGVRQLLDGNQTRRSLRSWSCQQDADCDRG